MGIIRGIIRYGFMAYFNLFYKIDEIGKENIPKKGGYVLVSNHVHWMDPVLYVCETKRMVYAIGKQELFNNKVKNFVMTRLGVIPVDRDSGNNKDAIEKAINYAKDGELFLIYPEGTRYGLEKGVKPKKGASLIALEAKVPIIPMAMVGSFRPFTKIRFKIDKPIDISEYYPKEGEKINLRNMVKVTNLVMDKVVSLRDELYSEISEKEMKYIDEIIDKSKEEYLLKKGETNLLDSKVEESK